MTETTDDELVREIALVSRAMPSFQFEEYGGRVLITASTVTYPEAMDEVVQPGNAAWRALVELADTLVSAEAIMGLEQ